MSNHYIYSKISGNSRTTGLFHTCPMNCVGNEFMPDACAIMLNVPVLYLLSVPLTFVINMWKVWQHFINNMYLPLTKWHNRCMFILFTASLDSVALRILTDNKHGTSARISCTRIRYARIFTRVFTGKEQPEFVCIMCEIPAFCYELPLLRKYTKAQLTFCSIAEFLGQSRICSLSN